MKFYSYLWRRSDGTPYYAGKGTGQRAYKIHYNGGRVLYPPNDQSRVLIFPQETETDAFESEKEIIWLFGRKAARTGCLVNLTDGGENPPNARGKRRSEATRQKMRVAQKGHRGNWDSKRSEETKAKMSQAQLGLTKGKPWTQARRAAGQPSRTAEEKAHLSEKMKVIRAAKKWSGHTQHPA